MHRRIPPLHQQLLTEVNRIVRIGLALPEPVPAEVAWQSIGHEPAISDDSLGWFEGLLLPLTHRLHLHSFGKLLYVTRYPFFATIPVPFTAIALTNGGIAATFRAYVKQELAQVALRFATEQLFAANHWVFPEDLCEPEPFSAVQLLAFCNSCFLRFEPEPGSRICGDTGTLALRRTDVLQQTERRYLLRWTRHTLAFHAEGQGPI